MKRSRIALLAGIPLLIGSAPIRTQSAPVAPPAPVPAPQPNVPPAAAPPGARVFVVPGTAPSGTYRLQAVPNASQQYQLDAIVIPFVGDPNRMDHMAIGVGIDPWTIDRMCIYPGGRPTTAEARPGSWLRVVPNTPSAPNPAVPPSK
jgi:hypothetical protein